MTSRWLVEVSQVRGFDIVWHPFSLRVLNEGREVDARHTKSHADGYRFLRLIAAAQTVCGAEIAGALYTAIGQRVHNQANEDVTAVVAEVLAELELPANLAVYASADLETTPELAAYDAALRESTAAGLELVGNQVGIPIIAINGKGFFGPVVTPAPTGQQALDLFDGLKLCMGVEGFYELKKTRTARPQFS